jgi:drug/metabolite transporter (DMT)-like permease
LIRIAALVGGAFVAVAAVTFAFYQLFARELILRTGPSLFTAVAMGTAGLAAVIGFSWPIPHRHWRRHGISGR